MSLIYIIFGIFVVNKMRYEFEESHTPPQISESF